MKKITILVLHLGIGGIEKYISSLCKMLENDFKIEIISTYKVSEQPAFEFSDKISIKYLIDDKPHVKEMREALMNAKPFKCLKYFFKNYSILKKKNKLNIKAIKSIDSDYIITTRDFHNNLVSKYASKDIIKIATEHNYHNDEQIYINNLIESIKGYNYLIVVSKKLQKFYNKKIGDTKCIYIPNTIDQIYANPRYNCNNSIVSIGRLSKEKGFDDLIDVINIVKDTIPNIHLDLIGDGNERENLELKIRTLKLDKNITLHGFKTGKEKEEIILKNSLYIMSSHTESFGIVLIEAMAYGLPCIAFDSAEGAKEVIMQNNMLIANRDKKEMAKRIIDMLSNEKELNKLGKENYIYCQKYLISNIKKEWINILKK